MTDLMETTGGSWHSAQTAAQTFTCIEPGCTLEAKARKGPASRCREHQAERKRAREATNGAAKGRKSGPLPTNGADPSQLGVERPPEAPSGEKITRGDLFRIAPSTGADAPAGDATNGQPPGGPFEARALQLATAGRDLDAALIEFAELKPRIEAARSAWLEAVESLPDANGRNGATSG